MVDIVLGGDAIDGFDIVGLERRINKVEIAVANLAVSGISAVLQYPLVTGDSNRVMSVGAAVALDVSKVDGYMIVATPLGGKTELWDDADPGVMIWSLTHANIGGGIARDKEGNFYRAGVGGVAEGLTKYNAARTVIWDNTTTNVAVPALCALTADESHLWVCNPINERVEKFQTSDGANVLIEELTYPPLTIAIDDDDNIYLTDADNFQVNKYNSSMVLQTSWGSEGTGDGQFTEPRGIAVSARTSSGLFVFVRDVQAPPPDDVTRIQAFDEDGAFLWERDVIAPGDTRPIAMVWGAQTEWFFYPTELTSQRISAGASDGGIDVPANDFYTGQIIRPNIIAAMQAAIEAVAVNYVNSVTGDPFTWTADADNLYTIAVDSEEDDWDKPTKEALADVAIRPDELIELDLCIGKLEDSEIITV